MVEGSESDGRGTVGHLSLESKFRGEAIGEWWCSSQLPARNDRPQRTAPGRRSVNREDDGGGSAKRMRAQDAPYGVASGVQDLRVILADERSREDCRNSLR